MNFKVQQFYETTTTYAQVREESRRHIYFRMSRSKMWHLESVYQQRQGVFAAEYFTITTNHTLKRKRDLLSG